MYIKIFRRCKGDEYFLEVDLKKKQPAAAAAAIQCLQKQDKAF